MNASRLWIIAAGLFVLWGCAPSNDRATLGEVLSMEALTSTPTRLEAIGDSGPSLTGLSRANWGRQAFLVPVDGTAGTTTYAPPRATLRTTARQRGQFPTAISSLDTEDGFTTAQWAEAGMSAPRAAWDFILIGPRMFMTTPWREVRGPQMSYWRATPTTLRTPRGEAAGAP